MSDAPVNGTAMADPVWFQTLLEVSDNACAIVDADYRYLWVNAAYQRLHAGTNDSLVGRSVVDVLGENDFLSIYRGALDRCLAGEPQCFEVDRWSPSMGHRSLDVRYYALAAAGTQRRVIGIVIADITERRLSEREARKLWAITHLNPAPIAVTDAGGRIEYVNPAFEQNSGYRRNELLGGTPARIKSGHTADATYRDLWQTIESGGIWTGELENRRKDGSLYREYTLIAPIEDDTETITHYVAIKQDLTALRETERDLARSAFEDPLTGLYTRNGFSQIFQEQLDAGGWDPGAIVMMVDIVSLRDINDAYAYEGGDQLLIIFSQRLMQIAGQAGLAGRIGGDECALLVSGGAAQTIEARLGAIVDQLTQPVDLDGVAIELSIRLGYTRLGQSVRPAETLLREAERALFRHRSDTALQWVAYTHDLARETQARVDLTRELRTAIQADQFELHFQPKVDLATGRLVSAEALLRWNHPERGLISPGVFIPIAEQSQLIGPIGEWALRRACEHLRQWQDEGLDLVRVAVNVSLVQFRPGQFPDTVRRILDESGTHPEQLSLEITESVFAQESATLLRQMQALRAMNVRLSLDDFGTGYSSLLYLQQYPFDEIKIDQGFVTHLMDDSFSRNIIEAVKMLAHALDAEIMAEGIESTEVRDALRAMGVQFGQGYYYSMPLEAEDFRWLLERGSHLPLVPGAS
jgi:PAS domain S-box-containing protein/diguanylate cyclase (GGDEF)-like protein